MKDVAKEAGVALSTVSHFLNGSAPLSEETKQKIKKAIEKLNYRPNLTARNLKKRKTSTIGLFVPDIANPFYAEIYKGVADAAREKKYNVILYATNYQKDRECDFVKLVSQWQVDGVIVGYSLIDENLWFKLERADIPVVLVDVYPVNNRWPSVVTDNEAGIQLAVQHLFNLGHREIAYLSEPPYVLSLIKRQRSFIESLKQFGLPVKEEWILVEKKQANRVEIGYALGKKLLSGKNLPTAVVASSDLVAIGAMKAFLESGLKIPDDMSIVGFDDIIFSSYVHPSLTTIRQPKYEMSKKGTEFLLQLIEKQTTSLPGNELYCIKPVLVKRLSCSTPRKREGGEKEPFEAATSLLKTLDQL
jgi:DNA-binding LacI/PurR family transcriptional regulator